MSRDILCPPLTPPLTFARSAALIDKVDLEVGDWIVTGTPDDLENLLLDLSETTLDDPDWEPRRVFQRHTLCHDQKSMLNVLGGGQGRGALGRPALVFGGTITITPLASPPPATAHPSPPLSSMSIRATLRLNLNRYLQAQPLGGRPLKRLERRYGPPKLVIVPQDSRFSEDPPEAPIVPDTNALMGSTWRYRYAASRDILDHFAEYFEAVVGFLAQRLRAIVRENRCRLLSRPYLSLQHVEACWEFSTSSPIDYVDSVRRSLEAVARTADTRNLRLDDLGSDVRGMSRRVRVSLNRTTQLRLYPKATGRVRYEAVLDRHGLTPVIRRRTSRDADQAAVQRSWLEQCIKHGQAQLAQAEALMGAPPRLGADRQSPHALLLHIVRATSSEAVAKALIASLVQEGCVRLPDLSLFRPSVERLVRAGVLRRTRPRSQVFVPSDEYVDAVEDLHSLLSRRRLTKGEL